MNGQLVFERSSSNPLKAKWVIGWAMVGRAEFAYLIAQMAAAAGMLTQEWTIF